jgi:predicted metal-dependent hydrolase
MKLLARDSTEINGKRIEYRRVHSDSAKKLRIRVGVNGVDVVQPRGRQTKEVEQFVEANGPWILGQLQRVECLSSIRRTRTTVKGSFLFRGISTPVRIEHQAQRRGPSRVVESEEGLVICVPRQPKTPPARTLENWLRKQAKDEIMVLLDAVSRKLKREPNRIYIMGQRTKWGNCSALQNLSFNWRLIMAPEFVARYLVTHEAVHLAVPDHSHKFWLTVQSLCPETERARQWLSANTPTLCVDLSEVCGS